MLQRQIGSEIILKEKIERYEEEIKQLKAQVN